MRVGADVSTELQPATKNSTAELVRSVIKR